MSVLPEAWFGLNNNKHQLATWSEECQIWGSISKQTGRTAFNCVQQSLNLATNVSKSLDWSMPVSYWECPGWLWPKRSPGRVHEILVSANSCKTAMPWVGSTASTDTLGPAGLCWAPGQVQLNPKPLCGCYLDWRTGPTTPPSSCLSKQHNLTALKIPVDVSRECWATLYFDHIITTNCRSFLPACRKFRCSQSKKPIDSTNRKNCDPFKLHNTSLWKKLPLCSSITMHRSQSKKKAKIYMLQ